MSDATVNKAPKAATMSEALPHAANRVRLAKAEQADATIAAMLAREALERAEEHVVRCNHAVAVAEQRLCKLAESGRVDAYCHIHDVFYAFAPQVPKKADGSTDHYTKHEDFWKNGAPPCPECRKRTEDATGLQGRPTRSGENWML